MKDEITLRPVGYVVGGRTEPVDDGWDTVDAMVRLDPRFGPEAVAGLDAFSHLEVVYRFHLVADADEHTGARRPRGNPEWPQVGIFAQRGKDRPNRIGVSRCVLLAVDGTDLHVRGLDAIDGTPVLDVKPYMRQFDARGSVGQPEWADALMADYW